MQQSLFMMKQSKLKRLLRQDDGKTRHPKRAKGVKAKRAADRFEHGALQVLEQLCHATAGGPLSPACDDVDILVAPQPKGPPGPIHN